MGAEGTSGGEGREVSWKASVDTTLRAVTGSNIWDCGVSGSTKEEGKVSKYPTTHVYIVVRASCDCIHRGKGVR